MKDGRNTSVLQRTAIATNTDQLDKYKTLVTRWLKLDGRPTFIKKKKSKNNSGKKKKKSYPSC